MFERETRGRLLDDSRGYGEIAATWQQQIKTEWDSRIDLASIATLPPSYYPPGAPPDSWGPGVGIPTDRPDDYGFMRLKAMDKDFFADDVNLRNLIRDTPEVAPWKK